MQKILNFYMDDSGTRTPNRKPLSCDESIRDFFALGGILVNEEAEASARQTAFVIAVERAAKYARRHARKLRVMPERSSKTVDERLVRYYASLKTCGPPFNHSSSAEYAPLTPTAFSETLHEIRFRSKSSPMGQMADLFLWPMALAGYEPTNRAYIALRDAGRLIESRLSATEIEAAGSKYSCFELVRQQHGSS